MFDVIGLLKSNSIRAVGELNQLTKMCRDLIGLTGRVAVRPLRMNCWAMAGLPPWVLKVIVTVGFAVHCACTMVLTVSNSVKSNSSPSVCSVNQPANVYPNRDGSGGRVAACPALKVWAVKAGVPPCESKTTMILSAFQRA